MQRFDTSAVLRLLTSNPILSTLKSQFRALRSALWLRPAAMCVSAVFATIAISAFGPLLPDWLSLWMPEVKDGTVKDMLRLMAGSMLTVATVTMSMLMLTLSLAAGNASPRAVPELMADPLTQNALGTFLSAFVFALSALLAFDLTGLGHVGTSLILIIALLMVANAIRYLVQWIHHIADSLKLNRIVARVYEQADSVLTAYLRFEPGDSPVVAEPDDADGTAALIQAPGTGFVQFVDAQALTARAADCDLVVSMEVKEGDFVHPGIPVMRLHCAGDIDPIRASQFAAAVVIGTDRSPEGDPLLGIELLTEIGCRALSPGINDPKTALTCIGYLEALLAKAAMVAPERYPSPVVGAGRVFLRRADFAAMIERAFRPLARDGADKAEILVAIADSCRRLALISRTAHLDVIVAETRRLRAFARQRLDLEDDRLAVDKAVAGVERLAGTGPAEGKVPPPDLGAT